MNTEISGESPPGDSDGERWIPVESKYRLRHPRPIKHHGAYGVGVRRGEPFHVPTIPGTVLSCTKALLVAENASRKVVEIYAQGTNALWFVGWTSRIVRGSEEAAGMCAISPVRASCLGSFPGAYVGSALVRTELFGVGVLVDVMVLGRLGVGSWAIWLDLGLSDVRLEDYFNLRA